MENKPLKEVRRYEKMLNLGIPIGAGTDATRVASYNPWVSLYWMVSGRTVGGTVLYGDENKMERLEALRLYTQGSAQLSREADKKGVLSIGMYADMAVLSQDYLKVPEQSIKDITSVLTILGGKIVYAEDEYRVMDPGKNLPISPSWSPVKHYGGYFQTKVHMDCTCHHHGKQSLDHYFGGQKHSLNPWSFGCDCFAY